MILKITDVEERFQGWYQLSRPLTKLKHTISITDQLAKHNAKYKVEEFMNEWYVLIPREVHDAHVADVWSRVGTRS